jgi:hypothetical protein
MLTVGGVFGWVFWTDGHGVLGAAFFVFSAAMGLYFLRASDKTLETTPWWLFW